MYKRQHIPKVLYYWRVHAASTSAGTAAKPYVAQAAKRAIAAHLKRIGARGTVTDGLFPSTYKVEYDIPGSPLVSILIPNKDHVEDLDKALRSIYELSLIHIWLPRAQGVLHLGRDVKIRAQVHTNLPRLWPDKIQTISASVYFL